VWFKKLTYMAVFRPGVNNSNGLGHVWAKLSPYQACMCRPVVILMVSCNWYCSIILPNFKHNSFAEINNFLDIMSNASF